MPLTQKMINKLDTPGRHADGGCLYLRIAKGGSKSWVFMFARMNPVTGKREQTEIGLGSATGKGKAGIVTLEIAREKAKAIHAQLAQNQNPLREKRAVAVTFGAMADEYGAKALKGSNSKLAAYGKAMRAGAGHCAALRGLAVNAATPQDIAAGIKKLWTEQYPTAKKVREFIKQVFDYAIHEGKRTAANPARMEGCLDALLPVPQLQVDNRPAVPVQLAPRLYATLATAGNDSETDALRLLMTTATRTGQTTHAKRCEFDFDTDVPVWTIPAERNLKSATKTKKATPHQVPLVGEALAIARRRCEGLRPERFAVSGTGRRRGARPAAFHRRLRRLQRARAALDLSRLGRSGHGTPIPGGSAGRRLRPRRHQGCGDGLSPDAAAAQAP